MLAAKAPAFEYAALNFCSSVAAGQVLAGGMLVWLPRMVEEVLVFHWLYAYSTAASAAVSKSLLLSWRLAKRESWLVKYAAAERNARITATTIMVAGSVLPRMCRRDRRNGERRWANIGKQGGAKETYGGRS